MSIILKNSSFGLIRTNPALTTNIKIVTDGEKVYLESIDADPILSESQFKKFEVTGGLYSKDLQSFYSQKSAMTKEIAYKIFERDSYNDIKDSFSKQYDFTYCMGTEYKNSMLYKESYCTFAPLWLHPSSIPDYFLIFKLDGPMSLSQGQELNQNSSSELEDLIKNPANLFNNYIKNAKIIKTFDLTRKTPLGKYIRDYAEDSLFPKQSVFISTKKDELSYWEGISFDNGGFDKKAKNIYKDYVLLDKTIIEKDNYITNGFYETGIVQSNILNLEFLFDDEDTNKYEFSRYFGLYVSESELGKFSINTDLTDYYTKNSIEQTNRNNIIENQQGVIIGLNLQNGSSLVEFDSYSPKFPYIKTPTNKFYSINQSTDWELGITGDFIRLKDKKIDLNELFDYGEPFRYIDAKLTENLNPAGFTFEVISAPAPGDQIRLINTDPNDDITRYYTITGVNKIGDIDIPPGNNEGTGFSINGSLSDIAKAISNAINYIEVSLQKTQYFISMYIGNRVVVYTRTKNSYLNKLNYTIFSSKDEFPFSIPNINGNLSLVNNYIDYPGSTNELVGNLYSHHFTGGVDSPLSKFLINKEDLFEFKDENDTIFIKNFIKTNQGYKEITDYGPYLEKPIKNKNGVVIGFEDIEKYFVCYVQQAEVHVSSSNKISLYKILKNTNGYLSIYPIKDFDFDFYSKEYSKLADSDYTRLEKWYLSEDSYLYGLTGSTGSTGAIENWKKSKFFLNGYKTLIGEKDDLNGNVENIDSEYNRLQENYLSSLCIESRVVPYINKWVYDNEAVDVRENPYRLNINNAFDYLNFSPSFTEKKPNPKLFTHEWYYLQKYPSYFTFDDKLNSFSYFDNEIDIEQLKGIENDYFLSYFIRESIGTTAIPRDFRYSIFEQSTNSAYPETMFRGIKIAVKDRFENSGLNFDINSKKFITNNLYTNYKFSAILTFGEIGTDIQIIKNDKFKNITLVVKAALNDPFLWNSDYDSLENPTSRFIDRTHLYTLKNKYNSEELSIVDKKISGVIKEWLYESETDLFKVSFVADKEGNFPNLTNEISMNESGSYNNIELFDSEGYSTYVKKIILSDIKKFNRDTIWCNLIQYEYGSAPGTIESLDKASSNINLLFNIDSFNVDEIKFESTEKLPSVEFTIDGNNSVKLGVKKFIILNNPVYIGGGYNAFENIIRDISFSSISQKINSGDPSVKYIQVDENGIITNNTFCIELLKPIDELTSTYLKTNIINNDSNYLQYYIGTLGYELTNTKRTDIFPISRQKGGFNPKFIDMVKFVDLNNVDKFYENTRICTNCEYGIIKNLHYNKVNIDNPNSILKQKNSQFVYPYIGEIAIDKKDFFIFKSNFDPLYYNQYLTPIKNITLSGLIETKENKSFFGSKVLSIPNIIRIETFNGVIDKSLIQNNNYFPYNVIKSIETIGTTDVLSLSIYANKLLIDYLIEDGISGEFIKYVNTSYIKEKTLDDYVKQYIKDNILNKYIIKEITLWEKFYPKGETYPILENGLTDNQKLAKGYSISKNFSITYISELEFNLKYNVPKDKNYSISFTIKLEKK